MTVFKIVCFSIVCSRMFSKTTAEILRPMQKVSIQPTYVNRTFNEQTKRSVYYMNVVAPPDTTGKSDDGVFIFTRVSDIAETSSVFDAIITIENDLEPWKSHKIILSSVSTKTEFEIYVTSHGDMTEQTEFFDIDCSYEVSRTKSLGVTKYFGRYEGCKAEHLDSIPVFNGNLNINGDELGFYYDMNRAPQYFNMTFNSNGIELHLNEKKVKADKGNIDCLYFDMIISPYAGWLAERRRWRLDIVPESSTCRSKRIY